ncbi:hypothetical protein HA402_009040 [Bradysia odoriphaga]|nr:hypothetical protein HA402_009040 [Bradysia odoriphaga]
MSLLCTEKVRSNNRSDTVLTVPMEKINTACPDPTFLADRCLENLLRAENNVSQDRIFKYFNEQSDITPKMRKIVAEWMMEVCEENNCQEEVFLLALNYMDRFLASTESTLEHVQKNHLQILAAACLLLASKLREPGCLGLPADLLVFYTDNSITRTDLIHWELIVLSRLKWDISSITPLDFLELLLSRLPITHRNCTDINLDKIRKHAQAFISLAAREHNFFVYSSSNIAASSIAASLNGMNWHRRTGITSMDLYNLLTDWTGLKQEDIRDCMHEMEDVFEKQFQHHLPASYCINITAQNIKQNNIIEPPQYTPNDNKHSKSQTRTPTDVQDVKL